MKKVMEAIMEGDNYQLFSNPKRTLRTLIELSSSMEHKQAVRYGIATYMNYKYKYPRNK